MISTRDGTSNPRSQFKNKTSLKESSPRTQKSPQIESKKGLGHIVFSKRLFKPLTK